MTQEERIDKVNALMFVIADNGRRFFYNSKSKRYASMLIDEYGYIRFVDDYTGTSIKWAVSDAVKRQKGFSHGGTLKGLVNAFYSYIKHGKKLPATIFGPFPRHLCNGDLWGYGDDIAIVREAARKLGLIDVNLVTRIDSDIRHRELLHDLAAAVMSDNPLAAMEFVRSAGWCDKCRSLACRCEEEKEEVI